MSLQNFQLRIEEAMAFGRPDGFPYECTMPVTSRDIRLQVAFGE